MEWRPLSILRVYGLAPIQHKGLGEQLLEGRCRQFSLIYTFLNLCPGELLVVQLQYFPIRGNLPTSVYFLFPFPAIAALAMG